MSRLTKDIRERMARKLVAYRYTDEGKELVRLNRTLADRVYAHCYTPELVKAIKLIQKHFPRSFEERGTFQVNANGFRVELGGMLRSRWVRFEQVKHDGYLTAGYYANHNITDEALAKEVQDFAIRKQGFDDVCATAYHEAMSVLNTMSTGKKLAEAWPEAMEVIGDLIPEGDRTLPVVQVSAINAKFKLPPKVHAESVKGAPKKEATKGKK